ncbi:MAG: VWA-like domain-containing protein [Bilifractor sp.]|jgi:predicted metal-dependent peptidase
MTADKTQNREREENAYRDPREALAGQILQFTRDKLITEMPYLNRAILAMPVVFYTPSSEKADRRDARTDLTTRNGGTVFAAGAGMASASVARTGVSGEAPEQGHEKKSIGEKLADSLMGIDAGGYRLADLPAGIGTNGSYIYCDAESVIRLFREDRTRLVRTCLHMIFHCLFRHPFRYTKLDTGLWDVAADIAAENAVEECGLKDLELPDDWERRNRIRELRRYTEKMTAESLYRLFRGEALTDDGGKASGESQGSETEGNISDKERSSGTGLTAPGGPQEPERKAFAADQDLMRELRELFHFDLHEPWLMEDHVWKEMIIRRGGDSVGQKWQTISSGVQKDMESFEKNQARVPGGLKKIFHEQYRKSGEYEAFLRKFARSAEEIHVNPDEFDYIYYTYGMQLYRNMPLIEPLEYRETMKIRDFVIALDTSGSCQGSTIRNFLHKTWSVLKTTESFTERMNLHIIQCDSEVQEDRKITSDEEFERYMKDIEISGSGGTDFRPVFERVDRMRAAGELRNLRGLLYFTDGYGTFPLRKPEYQTAFIFVREGFEIPKVPSWAMRLVLDAEDLGPLAG